MNKYYFKDNYVMGLTEDNKRFYFDKRDFPEFKKYDWEIIKTGYVVTKTINDNYDTKYTQMQYFIMEKPTLKEHKMIDHINQLKIDNRRSNLRIITSSENQHNCKIRKQNKTGTNGVCVVGNRFRAAIVIGHKQIYLGMFNTIKEAIDARIKAEKQYLPNIIINHAILV